MNNLHRELAPISQEAWGEIEEEAARTFKRNLAGRRVVDVHGPSGETYAAVGTGRQRDIDGPAGGVQARLRQVVPVVELRAPFTLDRREIDDVARGAQDADWQPVKDAARQMAFAEDGAIFAGFPAAGIDGIAKESSNPTITLPVDVTEYPAAIAQAVTALRMAGVDGPYSALLSADAYTQVSETSDHGYPVIEHIKRLLTGEIIWAPAISGTIVLTTRGDDFSLHLGQDLALGYLSHTNTEVRLYLQETFAFRVLTSEAAVACTPPAKRRETSARGS